MEASQVIHAGKGIKESFDNAAGKEIERYKDTRLFNIVTTDEWAEEFTSTEGMSGTKELSEHETPPTLDLNEGRSIILTPGRWGGSIEFTETDGVKAKDSTTKVRTILTRKRNALLVDLNWSFIQNIHYMYNNAFDSSAVTLAPDGVELCGQHITADGDNWFDNSDTQAMDLGAIETLEEYAGGLVDAKGKAMPITFDTIVVKKGGQASRDAKKLFCAGISPTQVGDVNIYEGSYTVIETPVITSGTAWFSYASNFPVEMPLYVGINKAPTMAAPLTEKNRSVTYAATGYWKRGINNMPLNFYGSNGTT